MLGGDPQGDRPQPQEEQKIYSRKLIIPKMVYPELDHVDTSIQVNASFLHSYFQAHPPECNISYEKS